MSGLEIGILIILASFVALHYIFKFMPKNRLTQEDYEFIQNNYILKHKGSFAKKSVQKAQQRIDLYIESKYLK